MTVRRRPTLAELLIGAAIVTAAAPASAQTLNDARDLYAGAAYAEALEVLDAVEKTTTAVPAMREALQYRALCLLALSRPGEAEQTIARLVVTEPTYSPDAVETPPQLRELFRVVREQKLPMLVREKYAAARQSFASRPAEAAAAFDVVLRLLEAPEVQTGLGADGVADMRTLATGFRDLAKSPAPAAPADPRTVNSPMLAAPVANAPSTPPAPADAETFDVDDADVVAPISVRQELPQPRPEWNIPAMRGLLEVVINRDGRVDAAAMRRSIHPIYDRLLLNEARRWRYSAATRNGTPVRYRKVIEVVVGPR
jgi:hypothetical protein